MDSVSPDDLADRIERGERVTLLDVRNRSEIDEWRIDGPTVERIEVPYVKFVAAGVSGDPADLLPDPSAPSTDFTEPVVAVCGRGEASAEVAAQLREAGVDAVNLAEGMDGWARVYRRVELTADTGPATVYQYQRPSSGCLAYLVVAEEGALVIDPLRAFADCYRADADDLGVPIVGAVDTHVHADHVSGLRDVTANGATAYMTERAVDRGVTFPVETLAGGDNEARPASTSASGDTARGDSLRLGEVSVEVVATPGHTTGMVSLRVGDLLVCGDTLFVDGVPRPDLEGGDEAAPEHARELHRTLTDRLDRFDDATVVAPGHYGEGATRTPDGSYTATLGDLRDRLWAFDVDVDTFVERVLDRMPPQPANFEEIIAVNLGREQTDDDAAFELELGPNNCAARAD